ncbi:hypothetical protein AB0I61_31080 [Polymorphospora rubra]|uniref:hypothetical protein n=1 Tax=Polymorphospora rubra TaxID=338584 RepID=UPI0033D76EE0
MAYGPNTIEINGTAMLLTTVSGGTAVHLTAAATPVAGREAVPDVYFDRNDRVPTGYDLMALRERRWSDRTICGRVWAVMVGGDGGALGRYGDVAHAPTCRRCLILIDRHFPQPAPDDRLALVAQLAADVVVDRRGFAEIHHVPGDQQDALRKAIRTAIRRRVDHSVRTHSINGVIYVECQAMYDRHAHQNDHEAADAIDAVLKGEPPPHCERDWIISWETWGVA